MNVSKISKLILRAGKFKKAGKNKEYLNALKSLRSELVKQKAEIEQGIQVVGQKIQEAERNL
jgi:hypothetical protein